MTWHDVAMSFIVMDNKTNTVICLSRKYVINMTASADRWSIRCSSERITMFQIPTWRTPGLARRLDSCLICTNMVAFKKWGECGWRSKGALHPPPPPPRACQSILDAIIIFIKNSVSYAPIHHGALERKSDLWAYKLNCPRGSMRVSEATT